MSSAARRSGCRFVVLALLVVLQSAGCKLFSPWQREDEYARAKNAIEGYEDKEGNWIRPEGSRADKLMNSDVPKIFRKIPGLGERKVDKDLARTQLKEANSIYQSALAAQGSDRQELFRKAAKAYIAAGKNWASSSLEQDAYFMAAESYFFAEDYPKAEDYYVKLIKDYPRTRYQDRVDQRRMEIGNY